MSLLVPGDPAPDFTLPATDGSLVTLSDLRGRRVVLYFYPRDDTPGCTIEACGFRDNLDRLAARGVSVFGINDNDLDSHQRFTAKYDLNFPLLADTAHGVIEAYGAWVRKEIRGRGVMCADRVTYLVDPHGDVEYVWPAVDPNVHVDEIDSVLDAAD
ncbi:MAG: peroxiredoxin [Chloroflexi bacterium]|nr:peroxiredoxin [Chloroflexota bacterium]